MIDHNVGFPAYYTNWNDKGERYLHLSVVPFGGDSGVSRPQLLLFLFGERVEMICVRERNFLPFYVSEALVARSNTRARDFLKN